MHQSMSHAMHNAMQKRLIRLRRADTDTARALHSCTHSCVHRGTVQEFYTTQWAHND